MMYLVLFIGFISLVLFILYRILRLVFRLFRRVFDRSRHTRERVTFPRDAFPKETSPTLSIDGSDFTRIANKTAYRHPRVESVEVNGNEVSLEITSQSGLSRSHAMLTFTLSGRSTGSYMVKSDNNDSMIPEHIGNKIRLEIKKHVGIDV